jgi:hypothetical protein
MKKKLLAVLLIATLAASFAQPSQSYAKDMLPDITSVKPGSGSFTLN